MPKLDPARALHGAQEACRPSGSGWRRLVDRARRAEYSFMVVTAVLIGLGGGFAAIGFRALILGSTWLFSFGQTSTPDGFAALPWYWLLFMPAVGGLVVGPLVHYLAPEAAGTGVPEVMEAVALHGGNIRKRVGLIKALAVAVCLGSGGSAGREGPIVHVGAAVGSLIGRAFSVPVIHLRTFVGCGAAAGIAATFNAPIAGALFAGEVILGRFGVVRFSAIVISSVVATVVSRHFIGDFPAFAVPIFKVEHNYELLFYAALGLTAALIGGLFIWLMERSRAAFARLPGPAAVRPAVGGLAVGALAIALPQVLGVGYGSINAAMHSDMLWVLMAALLGGKLLATALTLGSGGSGGIFAPSLFLGAMLGGCAGVALQAVLPGEVGSPGSYALVAMGAMVAATTRAPIAAIIIIFELTNNYTVILPLMIACILAALVGGRIVPYSIYHSKLRQRGIDLEGRQDINVLRRLTVDDIQGAAYQTIREETTLTEILELAVDQGSRHCVVADGEGKYLGMIHLSELRYTYFNEAYLAPLVVAADLLHTDLPALHPADSLELAMKVFGESERDALPVLDPLDRGRLLKVLDHDAVIEAYNQAVLDAEMLESAAGLVVTAERARSVELGGGSSLMELEAPPRFVGRALRELDLRRSYDVQVVLVRRRARPEDAACKEYERKVPGPDFRLQAGDVMLLVGQNEALERVAAL
ncbi:MAG: chloride channel protein [Deltaproteobacteria bacterium]|nr:chloride channel protein [Deltaproteobacteria bacterium]